MPSGAKKRKAAKKKKEIHPNNNPNPTQGGGNVKQQEDRQSDFGEASSTASQDPSHHDLLTEGEEEKIDNRGNVSNLPTVEGVKSEEIDKPVEREFKVADEFNKKNGSFQHDETERKSYDGGSSRSSSSSSSSSRSSSDDESRGIKSSQAVIDTAPVSVKVDHSVPSTAIGEASDAVVDSVPPVVSDKVSMLSEGVEPCVAEENDDRLSLSYNSAITSVDNEADAEKDHGVAEPLLVPPPRPVETTSWKGCCGLFELFTGSGR